jgi:integrase
MAERKKRRRHRDGLWLRGAIWWCTVDGLRQSTGCRDKEAAKIARARLERIAADPAHAASARTTVRRMIADVVADRKTAKGKTGGVLSEETLEVWRTKLGHVARIIGDDTPLAELTYDRVGAFLDQREAEGVSQHTRSKELAALRFALRLEKQNGAYSLDVDHVTRTRRFAVGYKPRKRHLTWEEIPLLLGGLLQEDAQRVPMKTITRARELHRGGRWTLYDIAHFLGCSISTVHRYLNMPEPKPTRGGDLRAKHAAWIIATGARRKESYRAELHDHDFKAWRVHLRGTKTGSAERTIPIAPPFRSLLTFAVEGRPEKGALFPRWANIWRSLRLACKRAGIEPLSPNDLRRTHSSLLNEAGVSLENLAPVMGHTSTRMLEKVYTDRNNLGRIERALSSVKTRPLLPGGKKR